MDAIQKILKMSGAHKQRTPLREAREVLFQGLNEKQLVEQWRNPTSYDTKVMAHWISESDGDVFVVGWDGHDNVVAWSRDGLVSKSIEKLLSSPMTCDESWDTETPLNRLKAFFQRTETEVHVGGTDKRRSGLNPLEEVLNISPKKTVSTKVDKSVAQVNFLREFGALSTLKPKYELVAEDLRPAHKEAPKSVFYVALRESSGVEHWGAYRNPKDIPHDAMRMGAVSAPTADMAIQRKRDLLEADGDPAEPDYTEDLAYLTKYKTFPEESFLFVRKNVRKANLDVGESHERVFLVANQEAFIINIMLPEEQMVVARMMIAKAGKFTTVSIVTEKGNALIKPSKGKNLTEALTEFFSGEFKKYAKAMSLLSPEDMPTVTRRASTTLPIKPLNSSGPAHIQGKEALQTRISRVEAVAVRQAQARSQATTSAATTSAASSSSAASTDAEEWASLDNRAREYRLWKFIKAKLYEPIRARDIMSEILRLMTTNRGAAAQMFIRSFGDTFDLPGFKVYELLDGALNGQSRGVSWSDTAEWMADSLNSNGFYIDGDRVVHRHPGMMGSSSNTRSLLPPPVTPPAPAVVATAPDTPSVSEEPATSTEIQGILASLFDAAGGSILRVLESGAIASIRGNQTDINRSINDFVNAVSGRVLMTSGLAAEIINKIQINIRNDQSFSSYVRSLATGSVNRDGALTVRLKEKIQTIMISTLRDYRYRISEAQNGWKRLVPRGSRMESLVSDFKKAQLTESSEVGLSLYLSQKMAGSLVLMNQITRWERNEGNDRNIAVNTLMSEFPALKMTKQDVGKLLDFANQFVGSRGLPRDIASKLASFIVKLGYSWDAVSKSLVAGDAVENPEAELRKIELTLVNVASAYKDLLNYWDMDTRFERKGMADALQGRTGFPPVLVSSKPEVVKAALGEKNPKSMKVLAKLVYDQGMRASKNLQSFSSLSVDELERLGVI